MTSFVTLGQIRLGFYNLSGTSTPDEIGSDQLASATYRITPKKRRAYNPSFHRPFPRINQCDKLDGLKPFCVVEHRNCYLASHRFPIAKRGNKFRRVKVIVSSIAESEKRR